MAPIEREHQVGSEPLGEGDDGGVGASEGKICIASNELRDAFQIGRAHV